MNGWQTYAKESFAPAGGVSLRWSPWEWITMVANFYVGADTPNQASRVRLHHDDCVLLRVYNRPMLRGLSKLALSVNNQGGFEQGGAAPISEARIPAPPRSPCVPGCIATTWRCRRAASSSPTRLATSSPIHRPASSRVPAPT